MHRYVVLTLIVLSVIIPVCTISQPIKYRLADSMYARGEFSEAAMLLLQVINEPISDSLRAEAKLFLGSCQVQLQKTDSAIRLFKEAAKEFKIQGNFLKISRANRNIASVFHSRKHYTEARYYYDQALSTSQNSVDSIKCYLGIIVMLMNEEKLTEAYNLVKYQLHSYPDTIVSYQSYYIQYVQGRFFSWSKRFDSAIYFFNKALIAEATSDSYKAIVYNKLGECYLELKNYKTSLIYTDSSYSIDTTNKDNQNLLLDYYMYCRLYDSLGSYKKALFYSNIGRVLSDSFYNLEQSKARSDAETNYRTQQIIDEKALSDKQSLIWQRNLIIALVILSLVAILAFFSIRNTRIKQKANKLLTQQKQQVQQLADELGIANQTKARLFSTIGHDLRSPISSLYASLKMQEIRGGNGNEEMSSQTVRLLDTLEELLIWSKSQMDGFVLQPVRVNMYDLFEELKEFYAPAALAENITLVNEAKFNENIHTDEHLLKTILRNALSNAIVNTLSSSSVYLTTYLNANGTVSLSIQNPCTAEAFQKFKNGFDEAAVKSSAHGYGIVLMKEFAQKINAAIQLSYSAGNAIFKLMF